MFSYFLFLLSPRILWSIIGLSWSIGEWLGERLRLIISGGLHFCRPKLFCSSRHITTFLFFHLCFDIVGLGIIFLILFHLLFHIHFFGGLFA